MSFDSKFTKKNNDCFHKLTKVLECFVGNLSYKDDIEIAYNVNINKMVTLWHIYECDKKFFNPNNKYQIVPIDSIIVDLIVVLNDIEGVETMYSCGGHEGSSDCYIDATHTDKCNEVFNEMLVAANNYNNNLKEIPMLHQSVKVETTVNVNVPDQLRCTLRIDGEYVNRKLRAALISYICQHLKEIYLT